MHLYYVLVLVYMHLYYAMRVFQILVNSITYTICSHQVKGSDFKNSHPVTPSGATGKHKMAIPGFF